MSDLIGADEITRPGSVPFSEFRPLFNDTFDLEAAPIVIDFKRDQKGKGQKGKVDGFRLNGFHERGIVFVRQTTKWRIYETKILLFLTFYSHHLFSFLPHGKKDV